MVTLESLKKLWRISFFHYCLVSELLPDLVNTLHVGIDNLTVLVAVAVLNIVTPLNQMEFQVELNDVHWRNHVDESKSHSLLGPKVLWKVEKIELLSEFAVYHFQNVVVIELYRDVFNHQSCLTQNLTVVARLCKKQTFKLNLIIFWPF